MFTFGHLKNVPKCPNFFIKSLDKPVSKKYNKFVMFIMNMPP